MKNFSSGAIYFFYWEENLFSKTLFNIFFNIFNITLGSGSGSKLGQQSGSGYRYNVFGSTTLVKITTDQLDQPELLSKSPPTSSRRRWWSLASVSKHKECWCTGTVMRNRSILRRLRNRAPPDCLFPAFAPIFNFL